MSPAVDTGVMLALIEVKFDGAQMKPGAMQEVRVQDSLALPAAFSVTFAPVDLSRGTDPLGVEAPKPKIGTSVEINLGAPAARTPRKVFAGEVTALEPTFGPEGIRLVVSGYSRAHRLHRGRKTRTFQKTRTSEIVSKIASEAGLSAKVSSTTVVHEFLQQSNETDWEFVRRLASMLEYEAFVEDRYLMFRPIPTGAPAPPLELEYGENTSNGSATRLHSFYPRASAAQQVKTVVVHGWDPLQKVKIEGRHTVPSDGSGIGIQRSTADAFGDATLAIVDAPVASQSEAVDLARSVGAYLTGSFVSAFGTCEGHPAIKAGTALKIKGLGPEFGGEYRVSSVTHVYGGPTGYQTTFEVLGRLPRDVLDLSRPVARSTWGDNLVIGIVTNNKDPLAFARVRVKYPTLDGEKNEGAWARVVAVGAGKDRGQLMLPQVGDEVLVGFEGGDPNKPYVLGALWNGKDTPLPEHWDPKQEGGPDGSYVLRSPKLIDMKALDNVVIKTDKDMTVEVQGKSTEKVEKTQEVTVKQSFKLDAATELTLVCGKAKIVLKQDGTINIEGGNITVSGQMGTTVKGAKVDVQGQGPVTVKGATVAIN
ncbi:MAG TPA: VgrG-related protein [Gaiellaceae bacterium]|nr:VgrG-related protein [Gaiellaceae bacterium]